jgi:DNA-binding transcriptional ArsR family regulator
VALPSPLSDPLVELIARRFRAMGEPMRIRILDRLRDGELSVGEIAEQLDTSQQNVSKHLAVLTDAGILARRKDGNRHCYRIADESVLGICEQVCGGLQLQIAELQSLLQGATP